MVSSVMYLERWTAHSSLRSEEQGSDEAHDGVVVGENADDVGAALDLAVDALDRSIGLITV
jgi:hypothetical protein